MNIVTKCRDEPSRRPPLTQKPSTSGILAHTKSLRHMLLWTFFGILVFLLGLICAVLVGTLIYEALPIANKGEPFLDAKHQISVMSVPVTSVPLVKKSKPIKVKREPTPEEIVDTTTEEVSRDLRQALTTLLRWRGFAHFRDARGSSLRSFSEGLLEALTEGALADPKEPYGLAIPPAEIAVALIASAVITLYKYEILTDGHLKGMLSQLSRGV